MGRFVRIALIVAGVVSGYYLVRLARAYLAERRLPEAFPAEKADDLLNPLRAVFMPARKTLARFDLDRGQTVLEVGPGPGYYTIEASRIVGPSGRLLCLDVQRGMIERLNSRLTEKDAGENVHSIVSDAMHLPLRSGTVDRVFLVTVLGEIPQPQAALVELRRVLADGGVVAIDETLRDSDYVRIRKLRKMCAEAGFVQIAHRRSPLGYTACFRGP
jgi:ubiquinone/menaquinone biosynthesis C-methylase UbiE